MKNQSRTIIGLFIAILFSSLLTSVGFGQEYNARNEFAITQGGTNGLWRYGYSASQVDNSFTEFVANDTLSACGGQFLRWLVSNPDTVPQIAAHNLGATCSNVPGNAIFIHPGQTVLGGGDPVRRAVVRWTAPANGTYQLTGSLQRQNASATADLKIIKNAATMSESVVFSGSNVSSIQLAYNVIVTVTAGDNLDFSVGDGGNGYNSDASSIAINISQPVTTCITTPANLQVSVPAENSPIDVQSVNTNATLVGDATYTNTGKVGRAFEFDGNGDYVRIEDNAAQRPATAVTLEGWFKFDSTAGIVSLISKPIRNSALNSHTIYLENGQLRGLIGNASQYTRALSSFVPQTGVWHHLAFTYDFSGGISTLKLYANGAEVTSGVDGTANLPLYYDANPYPFLIGIDFENNIPSFPLDGQADEISVYGRALSQTEIFSLVKQGSFGKCPPAVQNPAPPFAVNPSANRIAWFTGDGDTRDFLGLNPNGILRGDANFRVGRVGQSFNFDGNGDYVEVLDDADHRPTNITVEGWFKANSLAGSPHFVSKPLVGTNSNSYVIWYQNGEIRGGHGNSSGGFDTLFTGFSPNIGEWYHFAYTIDDAADTHRFFVNGVQIATAGTSLPIFYDTVTPHPLLIGGELDSNVLGSFLNGQADEVSLYSRALSSSEITAVYNAGTAGKLKSAVTTVNLLQSAKTLSSFAPTTVQLSDATVNFAQVTTAGTTSQNGVDLGLLPKLPTGSTFTGLAYDISTTAAFTSTNVCFNLPSLSSFTLTNLRVLHLEGGVWVNVTATGNTLSNFCTGNLTSLSPFAIVEALAPTAANALVNGRVTTANGRGIRNVAITLTTPSGEIKTTLTNPFGYYRFQDLAVGETYILSVKSKRYSFSEPTRVISLNEDLTDADFISNNK